MREIHTHKSRRSDPGPQVLAEEELGPGGAPHRYRIIAEFDRNAAGLGYERVNTIEILFQHGGVPENGVNGVTIEALLAICIDRLKNFQAGPFKCSENQHALACLLVALERLHDRTEERRGRGVEGKEEA